jgi:hypothetical protein
MAKTINRRLAELIDGSGQLQTGKLPNSFITTAHYSSNSITDAKLHTSFSLPASALTARDTDDLSEGSNLYYTTARWDSKLAAADTGDLSEGSNLYYTDARVGTYISGDRSYGNITTTGYIAGPASMVIDPAGVGDNTGTVVIAGNLQVDGTTTTINSTTMTVDDLNLTLASGAANAAAANGAGITVDGASATITYDGTNDEWDFNKPTHVEVAGSRIAEFGRTGAGTFDLTISDIGEGAAQLWFQAQTNDTGFVFRPKDSSGNNTNALYIAPDGEVGIGVPNPGQTLEIHNSVAGDYTDFGLRGTGHKYVIGVGNDAVANVNDKWYLYDNDNSAFRMVVDTSGKVGIGTDSPTRNLTVKAGSSQEGIELIDADESLFLIQKSGSSTNTSYVSMMSQGNTTVRLHADNVSYFNGGNFGIGTSAPSKILEVSGPGGSGGTIMRLNQASGSGASGPTMDFGYSGQAWRVGANVYNPGDFVIYDTNATTKMIIIKADGKVGIGTNNPTMPLSVQAASNAYAISMHGRSDGYSELYGASNDGSTKYSFLQSHSAQTKLYTLVNTPLLFGTNSTERMRLSAAGDLQLESGAANKGYIQLSTQSTSYALMGGNHWGYLGYKTGGYHRWFGSDGVEDMRLDNSGNLGIGGSPNARLDISASVGVSLRFSSTYNYGPNRDWQINTNNYGSSNWGGWSLEQSTAQQGTPSVARIGVHANGNVGINMGGDASSGLTSINPATALHVGGDITVGSADAVGTSGAAAIRFQNDNERSRISSIYASGGGGELSFYTDSTGGTLLKRMHLSNSGELRFFGPSNLQVGGITSEGNDSLVISGNSANSAGIHMHPSQSAVVPAEGSGRAPTNTKDLGRSANSWRNIYLGTGMVQPDNTHTLQHDGGTDRGYKFNLGFIRGGSGSYNHIKTSLPSNTNVMMKFEYDGWIYSGSNMHESVTFYTYHAQSTPHGPTYVDYGSGGGLANVYYSSDNYVVIVIQAHTSYTGGFLYAQCGRSHYTTDIQILATGSNSTTSGVF